MQYVMDQSGMNKFTFSLAFRTWELQEGYPVINVSFNNGRFIVKQERFFDDKTRNMNDETKWWIPINYATESEHNFTDAAFTHYFNDYENELEIVDANHNANDWFIFNKQQLGYYRVNYETENWHKLINYLKGSNFETIHTLNRVQLIDDSFALADAGYINYSIPYDMITYLKHELNFFAWDIAMEHINKVFNAFGHRNPILNVSENFMKIFFNLTNILSPAIHLSSLEILLPTIQTL
jgi:aminopeptidase N